MQKLSNDEVLDLFQRSLQGSVGTITVESTETVGNATIATVTVRPTMSSRVFTATVRILDVHEV
jgi:hypothetical protein